MLRSDGDQMTLYVSDLDGTLLDNDATLAPETITRINKLLDKGMLFTYATARSFSSAGRITSGLHLTLPVITYNGAAFYQPNKGVSIKYVGIHSKAVEEIYSECANNGFAPIVYALVDGEERCSWLQGKETEGVLRYLHLRQGSKRMRPVASYAQLFEGNIYYFALIGTKAEVMPLKSMLDKVNGIYAHIQNDTYYPEDLWLEAYNQQASKAAAVTELMECLGADKLVCFGDNLNDIPMFRVADEGYATQNAHENLKKIATDVIDFNSNCGVARWLSENAIV